MAGKDVVFSVQHLVMPSRPSKFRFRKKEDWGQFLVREPRR
jgi:hypothetical protein